MGFPVHIEPLSDPVTKRTMEIVERKGKGHPDSLADGISEAVSRAISRANLDAFGVITHHNTDEVQLVGGLSSPRFGGGTVDAPIYVLLAGRATGEIDGKSVGIEGIAVPAAKSFLDGAVRNLNVERQVKIDCKIGTGSKDLRDVFSRSEIPLANDTSFGVGHAPYSRLESLVLGLERYITSADFFSLHPATGEDVKVMGARMGDSYQFTVAAAFVDKYLESLDEYSETKARVYDSIFHYLRSRTDNDVQLSLNAGDGTEVGSVYLTVTGTSAEMGDDGSTGRGNRVNGLITPERPMSLEAASGKNPVNHVGKIYNLVAHSIASEIVAQTDATEAQVRLLSRIGHPITEPQLCGIRVFPDSGTISPTEIARICHEGFERIPTIMEQLVSGTLKTF